MATGGATWDTAGALDLSDNNYFDQADADAESIPGLAFTDEGYWTITPGAHYEVRLRTGNPSLHGLVVFINLADHGDAGPQLEYIYPSKGYDGTGDVYWFLAGETYTVAVGNLSIFTGQTYQLIVDAITPLATSGWYSDLKARTDNVLSLSTHDDAYGVLVHRSRNTIYGITREIDSPELGGMGCGWLHATVGDSDVIIWEGFCPPVVGGGSVDSYDPISAPYADADYDETHGGNAQEILFGAAIHAYQVHDEMPPNGVLPVPEPGDLGLDLPDWQVEWEQEHPNIRGIDFAGDDLPPIDPEAEGYVVPTDVGISYRDEHIIPAPPKIVPVFFNTETGQYDGWPKGGLSADVTLEIGPEWTQLYGSMTGPGHDWSYFFFPAEGEAYAPGDYTFGAKMMHPNDDNETFNRPSFVLRARFSLQASRYRFIYKPTTRTIPPRRIRQRGDGLTGGARGIKTGARTRQAGNRTIGGIL
jgi:hypothetical protein